MKNLFKKSSRYWLAHKKLPRYIFNNTKDFIEIINRDEDDALYRLINLLWERSQQQSSDTNASYMPEIIKRSFENVNVCVITMPIPQKGVEAYYAAVAYGEEGVRYFVLENSSTGHEGALACLCEWTKGGEHVNYGFTKDIEVEHFIKFVADEFINKQNKARATSYFKKEN